MPTMAGCEGAVRHLLMASLAVFILCDLATPAPAHQLDGFNVIVVPGHNFGSASARLSLEAAKRVGARAIAIVPFLWQSDPSSPNIERGSDMSDDELRVAIHEAHAIGFIAIVKPHVWIPGSWAGAAKPGSEQAWDSWFADYRRAIERIARIAAQEHADMLSIGTELAQTTARPEWISLIAGVRAIFPGKLIYFAHDMEEAERAPFWGLLDFIGVTLYPPLGPDGDRAAHLSAMRAVADSLDSLSMRVSKPVLIGEIGLRSAVGAAARPWQSAEERHAPAAPWLQAQVLSDWLNVLDQPSIKGVLIWRWFTDPAAGGAADTDFTVQSKPAERVLLCAWTADCAAH